MKQTTENRITYNNRITDTEFKMCTCARVRACAQRYWPKKALGDASQNFFTSSLMVSKTHCFYLCPKIIQWDSLLVNGVAI